MVVEFVEQIKPGTWRVRSRLVRVEAALRLRTRHSVFRAS